MGFTEYEAQLLMNVRHKSLHSHQNPNFGVSKTQFIKEYNLYKKFYLEHQHDAENHQKSVRELDIGFLFASPLIYRDTSTGSRRSGFSVPPPLHFAEEVRNIKHAIKNSKKRIVFKSMVATQANLCEMLNKEPRILHISCHGIENSNISMGFNYMEYKDEGNFLLLENSTGEGELVSARKLQKLITSTLPNLDLVFVAACDSEFVGRIFQKCGVKHVVCVKKQKHVLDAAAIEFTKIFY